VAGNYHPKKTLQILICTMLKWYLHHSAAAFQQRNALSSYWVSNANISGIAQRRYRRIWPYHLLKKPLYHLPFTQLEEWSRWWLLPLYDVWVRLQKIPKDCNVVMGPMGSCEPLFKLADAQRRGILKVFDAPNSHPYEYAKLWQNECTTFAPRYKIPFPKWVIERIAREISAADLVLCPSQFVKESMVANGVAEQKCVIRHFGVDTSMFQPRENVPESAVFVCVGSICVRKGHQYLFRAFSKLKESHPEARLICIGGIRPDFRSEWPRWRETIEHHEFLDHQQIAALMKSASAFILASVEEGFARVLSEAMAAGLPIIATHETGITTVTRHMEAAWVIPARSVEAIETAMRTLVEDRHLNETMGTKAQEIGQGRNTWQDYGDDLLQMINARLPR
jgi:glycosyltransferase involved in cell wall biosynthesis